MEKLTSVLAVVLEPADVPLVMDRATHIARHFHARVDALVADGTAAQAVAAFCAQQEFPQVTLCSVAGNSEPPHEVILRRVLSTRPDLVVKATARGAPLWRLSAFDEDWSLADQCPVPVLLARGGAWQTPLRFAATVDVSDPDHTALARGILHTAGFLALGVHGHLDILYSEREANDEVLRMQRAVRLAQLVREYHVGCERLQVFSGEPESRLPPLIAARHYDVLVLGGGAASPILSATDCDVVLVKAPAVGAEAAERRISRRAVSGSAPAAGAR